MNVRLLFFGIAKDLVQLDDVYFELPNNATVAVFKSRLLDIFPQLTNLNSYFIAVNESYANDDTILNENDEVAILPPVSGG